MTYTPREPEDWPDIFKICGWILLTIIFIGIVTSSPVGPFLLAVVVATVGINLVLRALIRIVHGIATTIVSFFTGLAKAIASIRITLPRRAPTKQDIANWLLDEHRDARRVINGANLSKEDRDALQRQNDGSLTEHLKKRLFDE